MFSLIPIAIAIMGVVATMSSFVVSAVAQPAGTPYCALSPGPPSEQLNPCFPTEEQCQAYAETAPGRDICIPVPSLR